MCTNCDEIIQVGNSGTDGWSPILALVESTCDAASVTVHQLVSWVDGTGTRPDYLGDIMTDQWLIDNPIYLGSAGLVTDICDATNLQPANGENGATGATGEAGPAGENGNDGCNPDISITASVVGGDKTYEVDVIPGGEPPCSPTYDLQFPIILFEEIIENLVGTAVNSALTVTPTYILDPDINIGTGDTSDIKYTLLQTISGSPSLNIDATYANWIGYYTVGNQLTMDFRINIAGSGGSGYYRLEMLIPNSHTSINNNFTNAIGYSLSNGKLDNPSAIITTNSTASTHLKFGVALSPYADIKPVLISDSGLLTIIGQITFLID